MPLIKVTSRDNKSTKLIPAKNLETLKQKAEEKFGFKIKGFTRKEDNLDIDEEEIFSELLNEKKEIWLIALGENLIESSDDSIPSIKVLKFSDKEPISIRANSLNQLKLKAEKEWNIEINKFVRKSDGIDIDEDEVLLELIETDENLCLIALQPTEEFDSNLFKFQKYNSFHKSKVLNEENDESNYFFDEYDEIENKIKALKVDTKASTSKALEPVKKLSTTKSILNTEVIELKKKEALEKLELENRKKEERQKKLDELKTISETVIKQEQERRDLEKKYREKIFASYASREASKTQLAKQEAKLLELELRQKKISQIFFDLKQAEKVDICFLMDCTGSMSSYINEAKSVIHRIVDKLKKRFINFDLRAAFVGYRDHSDGDERIEMFSFSDKCDAFKSFVSNIKATGGADQCEDIFGGLEEVTKLEWSFMSRVLFHIGDAPCHGKRFHNNAGDDYPDGDPRGLNIENLLEQITNLNINYYFAEINNSTIKMIEEFNKILNGNKIKVVSLSSVDGLTELVTTAVTASISMSKSLSMHSARSKSLKDIKVDPSCLNWSIDKMKKYKADYFVAKYTGSIAELKSKPIEFEKKSVEIYLSPKPFAKGALRFAYAGLLNNKKSVLKQTIYADPENNTMKNHQDMIECQVVAAFLAKEFFSLLKFEKTIKFIDVNLVHLVSEGEYYCIEDYISGEFQKWMNNAGELNEDIYSCTLDAFSHWTYQATDEYLIVSDLQGLIINKKDYILTDPAISSPEGFDRFSSTNLAIKGIQKFFETHQCNHFCKRLKLRKHKYQRLPDREVNPMMTKILG